MSPGPCVKHIQAHVLTKSTHPSSSSHCSITALAFSSTGVAPAELCRAQSPFLTPQHTNPHLSWICTGNAMPPDYFLDYCHITPLKHSSCTKDLPQLWGKRRTDHTIQQNSYPSVLSSFYAIWEAEAPSGNI